MIQPFPILANKILGFCLEKKKYILLSLFVLILITAFYLRQIGYLQAEKVIMIVKQQPVLAPAVFIVFYALMIGLLLPTLPLNLAAGFLWGTTWGVLITLIASALGAASCFLLSRYLSFDFLKKQNSVWRFVEAAIKKNDWKIIAFTRLNPIFPFGLISYFYGLTPIAFGNYFWATLIFGLPLIFLFSWLGDLAGDIVLKGEAAAFAQEIIFASLLLTMAIIFWFIIKSYLLKGRKLLK